METILVSLGAGLVEAVQPVNLTMIFIGCTIGLLVGAMPGLGSVNGVAILLPITFLVPPTAAIIFLAAIYYGAMYGGAISSITLGIPGASTAVATVFDGRPLAQQGKADKALTAAAVASFIGGTISVVLFTLFAPPLAEFALKFGPVEEFALMLLAFATFIGLGGEDIPKTVFSILIGLVLATIGLDIISGKPRLIFGDISGFLHGINFLVLAIGIYGIGEMLWTLEQTKGKVAAHNVHMSFSRLLQNLRDVKHYIGTTSLGSVIGYFVGTLPAAGATPASLMSYGLAKTFSKHPEAFGKGEIAGVAAPEAANNAASTGSMLPMITLGIPGSPTTAILLGGMIIWGLRPGPLLFSGTPRLCLGLDRLAVHCQSGYTIDQPGVYSGICQGIENAVYHPGADYLYSVHCRRLCADADDARRLVDVSVWRGGVSAAQVELPGCAGGIGDCAGAVGGAIFSSVVTLIARGCYDFPAAAHIGSLHFARRDVDWLPSD